VVQRVSPAWNDFGGIFRERAAAPLTLNTAHTYPPPMPPPDHAHTNPMHGVTLERMLEALVAHYGWSAMGQMIAIRCFTSDPSIPSSLKFLRRTPWARTKVESLYRDLLRVSERQPQG
jgi:DNA-binding protein VF530